MGMVVIGAQLGQETIHTNRAPWKCYTRAARLSMALIWLMQACWCNVIHCSVRGGSPDSMATVA